MKMPLPPNEDYEMAPAGNHVAVCYSVVDLGTQKQEYNGEEKLQRRVRIGWELSDTKMEDGRPFTISKEYTFSSFERANFRKDLESWRGKKFQDADFGPTGSFDVANVIGAGCLLNVVHAVSKKGKDYARVEAITPMPKGMKPATMTNDRQYLSLEENEFDVRAFDALPDWMREKIEGSPEYAAVTGTPEPVAVGSSNTVGNSSNDDGGEDIPF